jgi:hypothetical protein
MAAAARDTTHFFGIVFIFFLLFKTFFRGFAAHAGTRRIDNVMGCA